MSEPAATRPLRLARVVARLNVGGPALQAISTTAALRPGVETTLLTGTVDAGEAEAGAWLARWGVEPVRVPGLGRAPSPLDDLRALRFLAAEFRRMRPDVVHTHTAKAGALGRLAARAARVPAVVHTFHGHVLDGYFGPLASRGAAFAERGLARLADRIVAVSDEVARDLVERWRVAPADRVVVIPVGIPLEPFLAADASRRAASRRGLGVADDTPVAVLAGRLTAVKDPLLALGAWERVRAAVPEALLLVVGGGPLAGDVARRAGAGVRLLGWRDDLADVWAAADLALLTSRNEGTPVALIEAAASGVPAVATRVGGVPSVVTDGATGLLVPHGDAQEIADAVVTLLRDDARRVAMGAAARAHVTPRFGLERLLGDLRALYASLV